MKIFYYLAMSFIAGLALSLDFKLYYLNIQTNELNDHLSNIERMLNV